MTETLAGLCGTTITNEVRQGLGKLAPEDKEAVAKFGIDFATHQCAELLKRGVRGLHFYTMDRSKSVIEIINRLKNEGLL